MRRCLPRFSEFQDSAASPRLGVKKDTANAAGANEYLVLAVTMILNFVLEYLYTRYAVYRSSCDSALIEKTDKK